MVQVLPSLVFWLEPAAPELSLCLPPCWISCLPSLCFGLPHSVLLIHRSFWIKLIWVVFLNVNYKASSCFPQTCLVIWPHVEFWLGIISLKGVLCPRDFLVFSVAIGKCEVIVFPSCFTLWNVWKFSQQGKQLGWGKHETRSAQLRKPVLSQGSTSWPPLVCFCCVSTAQFWRNIFYLNSLRPKACLYWVSLQRT